jgi:hypothetical protein
MPGIVGPPEGRHRGRGRGNLHDWIVEARRRLQEPQAPAGPFRIHVDQGGDDLALRVGVDAAVPGAAPAANRDRMGSAFEAEVELLLESLAEFHARKFVEEFAEAGRVSQLGDGEAAGRVDPGIVAVDFGAGLGTDEAGNDEILERLLRQGVDSSPSMSK